MPLHDLSCGKTKKSWIKNLSLADQAAEVLRTRAFKPAVDSDWALSREKSITAVPTLAMNQHRVVGAQPYEALQELMEVNGVRKRV